MEIQHYDRQLENNFISRRRRKRVILRRPTGGTLPEAVTIDGMPMLKTGTMNDHIFKKLRKNIKKVASKAGKAVKQASKATGKGIGKATKAAGKGIKKAAKAVAKVSVSLVKAPLLAPLLPLRPMMSKALSKKGFKPPSKTQDLAEAFYNNIIKGKANFDTPDLNYDGYQDNFVTAEIVGAIVKFIKNAISKKKLKKSGEVPGLELSPDEKLVADESEQVIEEIKEKAEDLGIEIPLPGSNAKDSEESGVEDSLPNKSKRKKAAKQKSDSKKGGSAISGVKRPSNKGGSNNNSNNPLSSLSLGISPLVIGAIILAFILLRK